MTPRGHLIQFSFRPLRASHSLPSYRARFRFLAFCILRRSAEITTRHLCQRRWREGPRIRETGPVYSVRTLINIPVATLLSMSSIDGFYNAHEIQKSPPGPKSFHEEIRPLVESVTLLPKARGLSWSRRTSAIMDVVFFTKTRHSLEFD